MVPELSKSASSKVPKNHENIYILFWVMHLGQLFCVSPKNAWRCIFLGSFCHRKVFTKILVEILGMGFLGKNLGMGFLQNTREMVRIPSRHLYLKHATWGSLEDDSLDFFASNMQTSSVFRYSVGCLVFILAKTSISDQQTSPWKTNQVIGRLWWTGHDQKRFIGSSSAHKCIIGCQKLRRNSLKTIFGREKKNSLQEKGQRKRHSESLKNVNLDWKVFDHPPKSATSGW